MIDTPENQSATSAQSADKKPFTIELLECSKSRCAHILLNTEYFEKPDKRWPGSRICTCPKCGGDSFYTLDAAGRAQRSSDHGPRAIDPDIIQPSEKMGLKKRRRIFAAKSRALSQKAIAQSVEQKP